MWQVEEEEEFLYIIHAAIAGLFDSIAIYPPSSRPCHFQT